MRKILKSFLMLAFVMAYLCVGYSNAFAVERVSVLPPTSRDKALKNNMFQLKGSDKKFILLDNTDEGYFVLSEKYCATKPFSVNGDPVAFDPEDTNSIAYWLNHEFLESEYLPQDIVDNLVEREYLTEGGGSKVPFSKDYKSKCKVVLLSQTEWSKYNSKFGYADDTSYSFWVLRSVRELTGSPLVAAVESPNSGLTVDGKWSSSVGLRPAFYLSKDFFEKAIVDVENTGDAIISIIRNGISVTALNQMYSGSEIYTLIKTDIAPMADAVTIVGRGIVGEKITGKYSFQSLDSKSESGTMIQWQKSPDGENWSAIIGAETKEYIPSNTDIGCYVRMRVSPMTDSMSGASYVSVPLACKIRAISKPEASNVRIVTEQPMRPGTFLDAKYSYNDENRDICIETEYLWESSDDMKLTQSIGTSRYFKITNNEAGKYIRVGVIPKKRTNSANGRVTVSGDIAYSEWVYVENLPIVSDVQITKDVTVSFLKTDANVSLLNNLSLVAVYDMAESEDYKVVCEWQGADTVDGVYTHISSGNDVLEYTPSNAMWVRAKVYTQNDKNFSNPVYSDPMYIGSSNGVVTNGDYTLTKELTAGKEYEIWISKDTSTNSYAYSFQIEGEVIPSISSDKYFVKQVQQLDKAYIIGTSGVYGNEYCFKAGEMVMENNGTLTISNVLTTGLENDSVSKARVFIVEK